MSKKLFGLLVRWRRVWLRLFPQEMSGTRGEGNQLPEASRGSAPSKIKSALLTLEKLNIPFRGPFETSRGEHIVLIGKWILTQVEIVKLYERGQLDGENIERLLTDLRRNHKIAQAERELDEQRNS